VGRGRDLAKLGGPEKQHRNRHICVAGFIIAFHAQPEIVLHSPRQVTEN
jgi:hypothetical protein